MQTVDTVSALRALVTRARSENKKVALVATMGNLHEGHIALVHWARQRADYVVASIFVNPLQFGASEDLAGYPRTPEADREKLVDAGCDALFVPAVEQIYPEGMLNQAIVSVPNVSEGLCGAARPGHFDGMATVVVKLLNIVQPSVAVFGEKDYQQLAVIRSMARDLNMTVDIVAAPTIRAPDGLALSSRNGYLTDRERAIAPVLYACLQQMAASIQVEGRVAEGQLMECRRRISDAGFQLEYFEVRNAQNLNPVTSTDTHFVILVAARIGKTRLIDNLTVDLRLGD
ncbi:pantoate--beta-alanine ligase [Pseudomonas veronii]|uniref:pantoate--beta-alanine ligase n=1 Tax=Pseudomonas TaxID=286 RepID=UPI000C878D00|nr:MULTISPECIES: pantoate--beta-alanine ligase [Pseudomonas]PMU92544.1 pantoate--beta-alanine ligase [Pseudomonas sp. GW704-F3]PMU95673.1 pantoate--beta-alanine ligase [Pseudomonas sp. GW704-F5]PMV06887.1 pantoate--beta-alanine ligase [Pseudomonas sp. MPBD4-3]PMV33948.1 pantoate--beta-alanine ligase [Pseudomonas sp. GW704-F2]RTY63155.1 pantoate--beta-alanine ligase [Pseudomonas veronii]